MHEKKTAVFDTALNQARDYIIFFGRTSIYTVHISDMQE